MVKDHWEDSERGNRCHHMGYSFRLAAKLLLYASFHRQDNTYHGLCYTSCGVLAGTRNSPMGSSWMIDPMTHRTMIMIITWCVYVYIYIYIYINQMSWIQITFLFKIYINEADQSYSTFHEKTIPLWTRSNWMFQCLSRHLQPRSKVIYLIQKISIHIWLNRFCLSRHTSYCGEDNKSGWYSILS